MNKNKKIITILAIAVLMAVLAGMAVVSFLSPHRTTIYVFKKAYQIGTQITADMLVPVQVDSGMLVAARNANVNERFITSDDIRSLLQSGDSLKISVGEGTPLMRSLLSISGGNSIMMSMAPSSVAVTIEANNVTGVTQELYAGASVNVYVTSYSGGTFLLFENMRVLDIHRRSSGELSSVTLEVTNDQAVKLINSQRNGAIQFGLINPNGYVYETGTSEILVNPEAQPEITAVPETVQDASVPEAAPEEPAPAGFFNEDAEGEDPDIPTPEM